MKGDRLKVNSVKLSAIVHATEDSNKVIRALLTACPAELFPSEVGERTFKGHHGNEITTISKSLRGSGSNAFLDFLWESLPRVDRETVLSSISSYIDDGGGLHLRIDKQESLRGVLRIQDREPIKIEISFQTQGKSNQQVLDTVRKRLESLMDYTREGDHRA